MLRKRETDLQNKRICPLSPKSIAFRNLREGWLDHYLTDDLLFSRRCNEYTGGELPEKLHAHDYYELTLIAEGEGVEYIADGRSMPAERGMGILTKPRKIHMYRLEKSMQYDRIVVYFKDPKKLFPVEGVMDFVKRGNDFFAVFRLPTGAIEKLKNAADALERSEPFANVAAYLALGELFFALSKEQAQAPVKDAAPHFIRDIKDYIDAHYLELTSATALCEKFFYSREYISRCFRRYYNTPIYDYILQRKLLYCCSLLQKGAGVEESAHKAGFSSLAGFVKLFKKHYGCTPSAFKAASHR